MLLPIHTEQELMGFCISNWVNTTEELPEPKGFLQKYSLQGPVETQDHMIEHFGKTEVKLGTYQKLVRGHKELPVFRTTGCDHLHGIGSL